MPWNIDRLTIAEFEEYVAAAEHYRDHDTRFVRRKE